jgi:hypothetical protein
MISARLPLHKLCPPSKIHLIFLSERQPPKPEIQSICGTLTLWKDGFVTTCNHLQKFAIIWKSICSHL